MCGSPPRHNVEQSRARSHHFVHLAHAAAFVRCPPSELQRAFESAKLDVTRDIAVLGGAGGIGRALVAALIAQGDRVAVLDLPASLARHPQPCAEIPVDATSEASVAEAMAAVLRGPSASRSKSPARTQPRGPKSPTMTPGSSSNGSPEPVYGAN